VVRERTPDQTDRLILYLVGKLTKGVPHLLVEGGGVLTTMLAKLLFLVDVWSMQVSGSQATNFRYVRYKHGPYPLTQFEERLGLLEKQGLRPMPKESIVDGKQYRIYRLSKEPKLSLELSPQVQLLADEVMTTFANRKLEDVLRYVYTLPFVRDVPFGEQINLQVLKPTEDALTQVFKLWGADLGAPIPKDHLSALELALKETSNENIQLAQAMKEKQRKAFRLKESL
jgi:hypothetical protein